MADFFGLCGCLGYVFCRLMLGLHCWLGIQSSRIFLCEYDFKLKKKYAFGHLLAMAVKGKPLIRPRSTLSW